MIRRLVILLAFILCFATACEMPGIAPVRPTPVISVNPTDAVVMPTFSTPEPTFSAGYYTGNTYRNEYFKISLTLPKEWIINDVEQYKVNFTGGVTLLVLAQAASHTGQNVLPNINVTCTKLSRTEYENTISMDLSEIYPQKLESMGMKITSFAIDKLTKTIDGEILNIFKLTYKLEGVQSNVLQFSTYRNGQMIAGTITYDPDYEDDAQSIVDSIRLS